MIFVLKSFLLIPAKFHNALSKEKVREMLSQIITSFFDHAKEQQERPKAGLCFSMILLLLYFLILMYLSILSISGQVLCPVHVSIGLLALCLMT